MTHVTHDDRIERKENAEDAKNKGAEKTESRDTKFRASIDEAVLADYRLPNPFFFGIGG